MKHRLTPLILLSVVVLGIALPLAAEIKPDAREALAHIRQLCRPELAGRQSGTPGYRKAAEYVAGRMKAYGLLPGGDSGTYFQEVPLKDWRGFVPPARLEIVSPARRAFVPGRDQDFSVVYGTGSGTLEADLAFAGFGIATDKPGWDDYAGLPVKGRVVLVLSGAPASMDKETAKAWTLEAKVKAALARGAAGLIEMNLAGTGDHAPAPRSAASLGKDVAPKGFIVLRAGAAFGDEAFYAAGRSWRSPVSEILRLGKPRSSLLPTRVRMEAHFLQEDRTAPNVIGLWPGSDPVLKGEALVIGGHLDHLGLGLTGRMFPGADDDASGVAVMLETARALRAAGFQPARTLVFAAWAGEEMGTRGSRYFVDHPAVPLDKTAVYLNLDMVGAGGDDLSIGGMSEFAEFYELAKGFLDPDLKAALRDRPHYKGSDHTSFQRKGVTTLSLRTGKPLTERLDDDHPEYHRFGDLASEISLESLGRAARYQVEIVAGLANARTNMFDPTYHANFVHRDAFVADLHCDTVGRALEGEDLGRDLDHGHIDIPKLKRGGVDLQVFACYVGAPDTEEEKNTAAKRAFDQIEAAHRLVADHPRDLALVLSPRDVDSLQEEAKTGVLIGVEGGYAIENDLGLLDSFYRSGVRLMTLTHWRHTDWADASGDEKPTFGGLTDFGKKVVAEMNRLGMVIDVSHAADSTFWDVIKLSQAPIVASHSCCRALSDYHRNLTDDMLKALAKNGGVIGINFAPGFINAEQMKKEEAVYRDVARKFGIGEGRMDWRGVDPKVRESAEAEIKARLEDLHKTLPPVDVKALVDHIEHAIKVMGDADHVGLGSDFDGISSTPVGLENAGLLPNVTREMLRRGMKEEDVRKVLGQNFLRVFERVAAAAAKTS